MFTELLEKYKDSYSKKNVLELEKMEEALLHFDKFTSFDALELGEEIAKQSIKYKEDIAIRIVNITDDCIVFQYMGNESKQRNLDFSMGKLETVRKTGHCSLWAFVQEVVEGGVAAVFEENSGCMPVGGAFPVFVGGQMKYIITTSGLHYGNDYRVVVEAIGEKRQLEIPEFSAEII